MSLPELPSRLLTPVERLALEQPITEELKEAIRKMGSVIRTLRRSTIGCPPYVIAATDQVETHLRGAMFLAEQACVLIHDTSRRYEDDEDVIAI